MYMPKHSRIICTYDTCCSAIGRTLGHCGLQPAILAVIFDSLASPAPAPLVLTVGWVSGVFSRHTLLMYNNVESRTRTTTASIGVQLSDSVQQDLSSATLFYWCARLLLLFAVDSSLTQRQGLQLGSRPVATRGSSVLVATQPKAGRTAHLS